MSDGESDYEEKDYFKNYFEKLKEIYKEETKYLEDNNESIILITNKINEFYDLKLYKWDFPNYSKDLFVLALEAMVNGEFEFPSRLDTNCYSFYNYRESEGIDYDWELMEHNKYLSQMLENKEIWENCLSQIHSFIVELQNESDQE